MFVLTAILWRKAFAMKLPPIKPSVVLPATKLSAMSVQAVLWRRLKKTKTRKTKLLPILIVKNHVSKASATSVLPDILKFLPATVNAMTRQTLILELYAEKKKAAAKKPAPRERLKAIPAVAAVLPKTDAAQRPVIIPINLVPHIALNGAKVLIGYQKALIQAGAPLRMAVLLLVHMPYIIPEQTTTQMVLQHQEQN